MGSSRSKTRDARMAVANLASSAIRLMKPSRSLASDGNNDPNIGELSGPIWLKN
jgi:hypothetical protein